MVLGNQWKINIKHSFVGIKNQLIHVFRNAYLFSRFVTQLFLIILWEIQTLKRAVYVSVAFISSFINFNIELTNNVTILW